MLQQLLRWLSSESIYACCFLFCGMHIFATESMLQFAILFQELMTRHKSTVAEFLSKNYEWVGSPSTLE